YALAAVGGVGDLERRAGGGPAWHQRGRAPVGDGGIDLVGEAAQQVVVGEVGAHGVVPFGMRAVREAAVEVDRQRDARMGNGVECGNDFDRIAHQVVDR